MEPSKRQSVHCVQCGAVHFKFKEKLEKSEKCVYCKIELVLFTDNDIPEVKQNSA